MRGGKREGAGRPFNKEKTMSFHRRVTPDETKKLDEYLKKLRDGIKPVV